MQPSTGEQGTRGTAHLGQERGDAGVHDLLGQHLLLVQEADELDVAQRAPPRLQQARASSEL